jgi:predicted Zn-dependent protease
VDKAVVAGRVILLDCSLDDRLSNLANRVVDVSAVPDAKFRVRVISDPVPDAYSLTARSDVRSAAFADSLKKDLVQLPRYDTMTRFIYVTSGLLDVLGDTAEVTAVLAREVAHFCRLDQSAALQAAADRRQAAGLVGDVVGLACCLFSPGSSQAYQASSAVGQAAANLAGGFAVIPGYGRAREVAADTLALRYLRTMGLDSSSIVRVLRRLLEKNDTPRPHGRRSFLTDVEPGLGQRLAIVEAAIQR